MSRRRRPARRVKTSSPGQGDLFLWQRSRFLPALEASRSSAGLRSGQTVFDSKSLDAEIRILRKRVNACDRMVADLLACVAALPYEHPERRATLAEVLTLRRRGRQVSFELRCLLRLRNTPTNSMGRA